MDDYQKLLEKSIRFLSYRIRSEKEVRDNLLKPRRNKSGSVAVPNPEAIDRVIDWLKAQKFINDEEFVRQWMQSRNRSHQKSMQIIKFELLHKGISQEIIEKGLQSLDNTQTDAMRAKKLAEKKIRRYAHLPKQEMYRKLGGILARNGFSWEIIKASIDEVLQEEYNS